MSIVARFLAPLAGLATALVPVAAQAQVFLWSPDYRGAPVMVQEPDVILPLPGATDAEFRAGVLWSLRAGLNVAALQCQSYPLVDAVANYNAMLANHGDELKPAYDTLLGYFKRTFPGAAGLKAFDDYNTRTYNGYSTYFGQNGFCQTAGLIGRDVMFAPRGGGLMQVATTRLRELRNSLVPATDLMWRSRPPAQPYALVADFPAKCYDRKGQVKRSCLRD